MNPFPLISIYHIQYIRKNGVYTVIYGIYTVVWKSNVQFGPTLRILNMTVCMVISLLSLVYIHRICGCMYGFGQPYMWYVDLALLDMLLCKCVHVHPHMICGSSTVGYAAAQLCPCTPTHDPALLLLSNYQHTHTHKWQPAEYAHRRMSLLSATSRTQTWRTCWICTQEDELVKCNKQNANMDMLNMHTGGWAC